MVDGRYGRRFATAGIVIGAGGQRWTTACSRCGCDKRGECLLNGNPGGHCRDQKREDGQRQRQKVSHTFCFLLSGGMLLPVWRGPVARGMPGGRALLALVMSRPYNEAAPGDRQKMRSVDEELSA